MKVVFSVSALLFVIVFMGLKVEGNHNKAFDIPEQTISCPEYAMRGETPPYDYCNLRK